MNERVSLEIRDQVAYVTLTRGEKYNGLDFDMFVGLVETARRIRKDRSIRAVILRGDGPAFSTGLDVASFFGKPGKALRIFLKYGIKTTNLAQEAAWCWRRLPVPVIAVVHGRCYGGALQIALAADFRFSTPDCEFSIMEVKWGLIPDMSGSVTLRELLPIDQAKRLTMTGELFDGRRARELNLVTDIGVDPLAMAEALVTEIKTRSPDAVAAAKALFQKTWAASERRAFAVETRLQWHMFLSRNQRVAVKAGLAKQTPTFGPRQYGG
ncbi:MAG TPA: crotonase/enoyl-CoA hydratase family protein [Nevskiales bacterium]|nr:crotonase/enoyl-CoA hydratase family protein [Nevskiales bacterium]